MRYWLKRLVVWVWVLIAVLTVFSLNAQQETLPYIELRSDELQDIGKIAWRPDSQQIAVANGSDVVLFTRNLTEVARLQGHTDLVTGIDWSPDGTQLVSVSKDTTV